MTLQADAGNETFGNITFVDSGAVDLDSSASANGDLYINASTDGAVGGNLSVTANGDITQNVVLAVTGTTTLAAGSSNDITLGNTSNNFQDAVIITSGANVAVTDTNAIKLGASTVSGT